MSEPFNQLLGEKTIRYISSNADRGRIYGASFVNEASADGYAQALIESGPTEEILIDVPIINGQVLQETAIAVNWNGCRVIVARAHQPSAPEDSPDYHHGQGFATKLRNVIGSGDFEGDLILITDFDLETISRGSEDLNANGGPLDPATIYEETLSQAVQGDHARALLDAVKDVFPSDTVTGKELGHAARLVQALNEEDYKAIPEILGQFPRMMTADTLSPEWFKQVGDFDSLKRGARNALRDNQQLARKIQSCHTVGTNTASCLEAQFGEKVAERILKAPAWRQLGHAEINALAPPKGGIKFQSFITQPKENSSHEAPADTERQKTKTICLRIPIRRNVIQLRLKFSRDLGDTPFELRNLTCPGKPTKQLHELICTFEPGNRAEAQFATLRVWLGNKSSTSDPRLEFQIALLPLPVFNACRNTSLLVDAEKECLIARSDDTVEFEVGGNATSYTIERPHESIEVHSTMSLDTAPGAGGDEGLITNLCFPECSPIQLSWRTLTDERETVIAVLPLFLEALANPADWSAGDGLLPDNHVNYTQGCVELSNGRTHSFSDATMRLLQVERDIRDRAQPWGPFEVTHLDDGTLKDSALAESLDADVQCAVRTLMEFFQKRGTTPSTDTWDANTVAATSGFLQTLLNEVPDNTQATLKKAYRALARIGVIEERDANRTIITPYHPLVLAFQIRLAEFRNDELSQGNTNGVRDARLLHLLDPTGHMPFIMEPDLKRGGLIRGTQTWMEYIDRNRSRGLTPKYVQRLVKSKIAKFIESYPALVEVHENRPLVINCVQLGDLEPVIHGLFDLYKGNSKHKRQRIRLRIFGDDADGAAIDSFFDSRGSDPIRQRLEAKDDQAVNALLRNVSFTKQPTPEEAFPSCHIALVRNILDVSSGTCDKKILPSGSFEQGLFGRQSSASEQDGQDIHFTVGFGASSGNHLVEQVANSWNPLFAAGTGSYDPTKVLTRTVSSTQEQQWDGIWKTAMWVIHVEPNVGLDFYLKGKDDSQPLLIHYSDQYEPTSPEYDAITSTRYKGIYLASLTDALVKHGLGEVVKAEVVLDYLVAIDGGAALESQRTGNHKTMEFIGLAGSLAITLAALKNNHPDYTWVVLSLDEIVRQSRRSGTTGKAMLQFSGKGYASDDLCFVGINPINPGRVPLFMVEAKGGTSSPATGVKQIIGARKELLKHLTPGGSYADRQLMRSVFGRIIVDAAQRLHHYGIIKNPLDRANENALMAGTYTPWFPTDGNGCQGLVVQVRKDIAMCSLDQDKGVAVLQVPTSCLSILRQQELRKALPGLDPAHLALQLDPPIEDESSQHTGNSDGGDGEVGVDARPDIVLPDEHSTQPKIAVEPITSAYADASGVAHAEDGTTMEEEGGAAKPEVDEPGAEATPSSIVDSPTLCEEPTWGARVGLEDVEEERPNIDLADLGARVQQVCREHGVNIRPIDHAAIRIGPRHVTVPVALKPGEDIYKLQRNLGNIALKVQAAGPITAKTSHHEGVIKLLVPHNEPATTRLGTYFASTKPLCFPKVSIPLGADADYKHQHLDLTGERHVLVAGATGSGKSSFLKATALSLAIQYKPTEVKISILDPKGLDFGAYTRLPHVGADGYVDEPEACIAYLSHILDTEMAARKAALRESGYSSVQQHNEEAIQEGYDTIPHHVIIIDEYADLSMSAGKAAAELETNVCRLAQVGRAFGYSIILATQRPSADIVSGKIKANFPCRISFRLPSGMDSKVILDESGAEDLLGNGDAMIKSSVRDFRVQSYFVPRGEEKTIMGAFHF